MCGCTRAHVCVCVGTRSKCLSPDLMAGTGDCSLLRKLKNTRPPHTFGIKSLGQIDGKVEVQIEIGLNNNIQDNYLYNVDFSAAQNSRSTYLH